MEYYGHHHPRYFYPHHPYRVIVPPEHVRYSRPVFAYPRCTCECFCESGSAAAARTAAMENYSRTHRPDMGDDENSKEIDDVFSAEKAGRRNRTTYKRWQIEELERAFVINPYPTSMFKKTLAVRLGLRDSRVQVWFQNRRAKSKRSRSGSSTKESEYGPRDDEYSPKALPDCNPNESDYCPSETDNLSTFGEELHSNANEQVDDDYNFLDKSSN